MDVACLLQNSLEEHMDCCWQHRQPRRPCATEVERVQARAARQRRHIRHPCAVEDERVHAPGSLATRCQTALLKRRQRLRATQVPNCQREVLQTSEQRARHERQNP